MSEVKRYSPREISDAYTNTFRDRPLTAPLCDYVAAGAYAALARDLAACKIARDGWMKASDEAHARIRELEAALAEARQLLSVYRVQRDHAEAALAPPTPQDRGGEP